MKGWWEALSTRELAKARQLAGVGQEGTWLEDSQLGDAENWGLSSEQSLALCICLAAGNA